MLRQGHIALDAAVFPEGTHGLSLDTLARAPLWRMGLNYRHGTGHGVGAALNVHEGPHSISFRSGPPLKHTIQSTLAGLVVASQLRLPQPAQHGRGPQHARGPAPHLLQVWATPRHPTRYASSRTHSLAWCRGEPSEPVETAPASTAWALGPQRARGPAPHLLQVWPTARPLKLAARAPPR